MVGVRINLPLTDEHCQGTLALTAEMILTFLSSYYHQDFHSSKIHPPSQESFRSCQTPTYRAPFGGIQYR